MLVKIDDSVDIEKWNELLAISPLSSPFQTPDFYKLYNQQSHQSAKVFAIAGDNSTGHYDGICVVTLQKEKGIKGYFSRRAIVYGGPVLRKEFDEKTFAELLKIISKELKHQAIYGEIRNYFDYSSYSLQIAKNGWNFVPYLNFEISLVDKTLEVLLAEMKYNRRREIRLSLKENATFRSTRDEKDILKLYEILANLYQTRVKLPLPESAFFLALSKLDIGKTFIVEHEGEIIGGSFCLYYAKQGIYTMYYCGLRNYHKKIFPTHLAIWATLSYAFDNGLQWVDLMGAGKPGEEYGVRKYKAEFGGTMVEHGRYMKIFNLMLYQLGKKGLEYLKKRKS